MDGFCRMKKQARRPGARKGAGCLARDMTGLTETAGDHSTFALKDPVDRNLHCRVEPVRKLGDRGCLLAKHALDGGKTHARSLHASGRQRRSEPTALGTLPNMAEKTTAPKKVLPKPLSEPAAKKSLKKTAAEKSSEPAAQKTPQKPSEKKSAKTIETPLRVKTAAKKSAQKPLSEAATPPAQKTLKKVASEVKEPSRPARPSTQAKATKRASAKSQPGRVSKA